MRLHKLPLLFVALAIASAGCAPRLLLGPPPLAFAPLAPLEVAAVVAATRPIAVVEQPVYAAPPVFAYSGPEPRPVEAARPPSFDLAAAHAALDAVDPSACWAPGSARGYGKVRVTYGANGQADRVEVTNPAGSAPPDSACMSDKYGATHVPPFQGASVAVSSTFFVR
jgi:hypothetical protein